MNAHVAADLGREEDHRPPSPRKNRFHVSRTPPSSAAGSAIELINVVYRNRMNLAYLFNFRQV